MTASDLRDEVEPALDADVDVEEHDVDGGCREFLPRLLDRRGLVHGPAVELEVDATEKTYGCVIVDDQHGVAGRVHRGPQFTRNPIRGSSVYYLKMRNDSDPYEGDMEREIDRASRRMPRPSPQFRRRCWLAFQRALDPLAKPRPLRGRRQR